MPRHHHSSGWSIVNGTLTRFMPAWSCTLREPSTRLPSETVTTAFSTGAAASISTCVSTRAASDETSCLAVEYVFQTQLVPALKFYRTPDARRNQPRTPVPAVMIARLAGEGAEFFPVESPVVRLIVPSLVTVGQGFVLRQGLVDRGVEIDAQYVAALLEQGFDFGGPAAEHVVRRQDPGFVQEDVGIGVQTEELQPDVFVAARQRSGVEGDFVDPVFLVDPLQGAFVEPVVGIFDQSVVQQVGVHHARAPSPDAIRFGSPV